MRSRCAGVGRCSGRSPVPLPAARGHASWSGGISIGGLGAISPDVARQPAPVARPRAAPAPAPARPR